MWPGRGECDWVVSGVAVLGWLQDVWGSGPSKDPRGQRGGARVNPALSSPPKIMPVRGLPRGDGTELRCWGARPGRGCVRERLCLVCRPWDGSASADRQPGPLRGGWDVASRCRGPTGHGVELFAEADVQWCPEARKQTQPVGMGPRPRRGPVSPSAEREEKATSRFGRPASGGPLFPRAQGSVPRLPSQQGRGVGSAALCPDFVALSTSSILGSWRALKRR